MSGKGRARPKKVVPPTTSQGKQSSCSSATTGNNNNGGSISTGDSASCGKTLVSEMEENPKIDKVVPPVIILKEAEEAETPQKLWVDVISNNRNPSNGMQIEFVAPQLVNGEVEVAIEEEDILSELRYWESALIMYVIGSDLSMNMVKQYMLKNWNFVKMPYMFYNDEGYFILHFHSVDDKDLVLMKGPYTIRNMAMLLRDWK